MGFTMNFFKKLKLLVVSICICSSIIFPSSFSTPHKNNKTKRDEFPYTSEVNDNIAAPIESPNNVNFFGFQDTMHAIADDENENAAELNNFFGGFNFLDEQEKRTFTPEQELRHIRRFTSRSANKEKEEEEALKKEDQDNTLRAKIVLTSIVSQIEINDMIQERSKDLSQDELNFLSMMNSVSATTLNPRLIDMQNVTQIESFREITENFTNASKLHTMPYAIIYLNICAELYPIAQKLNQISQSMKLCVKTSKSDCTPVTSFDFYHVFIGEMKATFDTTEPSINYQSTLKGGHLYLPVLTPKIRLFESYNLNKESGCFNLIIKTLTTQGRGIKTYYPYGQTPYEIFYKLLSAINYHNSTYSPKKAGNITIYTQDDPMTSIKLIGKDVDTIVNITPSGQTTFFPSFKNN